MPTLPNSSKVVTFKLKKRWAAVVLAAASVVATVVVEKGPDIIELVRFVVNAARAAGVSKP